MADPQKKLDLKLPRYSLSRKPKSTTCFSVLSVFLEVRKDIRSEKTMPVLAGRLKICSNQKWLWGTGKTKNSWFFLS